MACILLDVRLFSGVQTSLELSEPVDIQWLPGLHNLWQKHNLNMEGDAAHFVHSLWIHSQTRVMQYRYTEIKEGGYITQMYNCPSSWTTRTSSLMRSPGKSY